MWCGIRDVFVTDKSNTAVCVLETKQNSEEEKENKLKEGKRERNRGGRKKATTFLGFDSK